MSSQIMLSFLLITAIIPTIFARSDRVPVLMWTNDDSVTFPDVLAGHTVTAEDFNGNYVQQLLAKDNENIVVFIQDKLSVADISHYADLYGYKADDEEDVFANVKSIMSELSSSHLPNVLSPLSVLNTVREHHVNTHVLKEPFNIEDQLSTQKNGERMLLIVQLPATVQTNFRKSMSHIDKIIGSVTNQLKSMSLPFTALYTATASSRAPQLLNSDGSKKVRHLLSTGEVTDKGMFYNASDEICLFLGHVSLTAGGNSTLLELGRLGVNYSMSACDNTSTGNSNCTLMLNYQGTLNVGTESFEQLSFVFMFTASGYIDVGYWAIYRLTMSYVNGSSRSDESHDMDATKIQDWTPVGLSYSCYAPGTIKATNVSTTANVPHINFAAFQIQAFGGFKNGGFGQYNDCQGFFSIPIWMAIICMVVLISVLVFGIQMLTSITTMDRYDDAKGKTITVTATD